MFSVGLSSILGSNPYSLLTGSSGSSAGGQDAFKNFLTSGGASNSSPGLYPSVSSLLSSGSKQPSGSSGSNPFQGLSQNQINSLWGMGNPMAGLAPAGGRSMFGAYGGAGGGGHLPGGRLRLRTPRSAVPFQVHSFICRQRGTQETWQP